MSPLLWMFLETYIDKIPDLNLVTKCNNALEANAALKDHDIDLMFLDIQMHLLQIGRAHV